MTFLDIQVPYEVLGISFFSTILAVILSLILMYQHLRYFTQPKQQRCIVRIILMVPMYALYSFIALMVPEYQRFFAIARDSYEAYALYQFFVLCIDYANGEDNLINSFLQQPPMKLIWPLNRWSVQPNKSLLINCRRGILQYAIIKPLMSIAATILMPLDLYTEGDWDPKRYYLWSTLINNICVTISLYCLALFYTAAREELQPYKPLIKFATIKMIVFFCYWQSIIIAIGTWFGLIPSYGGWSPSEVAVNIQNVLICFEMFVFSILHWVAFPYDGYKVGAMSQAPLIREVDLSGGGVIKGVQSAANQTDIVHDTVRSFIPQLIRDKFGINVKDTGANTNNNKPQKNNKKLKINLNKNKRKGYILSNESFDEEMNDSIDLEDQSNDNENYDCVPDDIGEIVKTPRR